MTLSLVTHSIKSSYDKLGISDTQQNDAQHNNALRHYTDSCYAERHYAECHYTECCHAERHYTKCRHAECCGAVYNTATLWVHPSSYRLHPHLAYESLEVCPRHIN